MYDLCFIHGSHREEDWHIYYCELPPCYVDEKKGDLYYDEPKSTSQDEVTYNVACSLCGSGCLVTLLVVVKFCLSELRR